MITRLLVTLFIVAGRSTIDAILALRLLSKIHREYDRPLNVVYLDIKAAFDSVDRLALWKAHEAEEFRMSFWILSLLFTKTPPFEFVWESSCQTHSQQLPA